MLTIHETGTECGHCLSEKQVWNADFEDGPTGDFCWKCLGKMLEARAKKEGDSANSRTGSHSTEIERE